MANNQLNEAENNSNAADTFPLIYDCVYELFNWLGFEECMGLSEAYNDLRPIASRMYKRKFNELALDFHQPIYRILNHAGPTAKSLTLTLNEANYRRRELAKIGRKCKQLRCLTLNGFDTEKFQRNPLANIGKGKLEVLTLNQCSFDNETNFFDGYKNLKSFNVFNCPEIDVVALGRCFDNNREIESLTCDDQLIPRMLLLLPNLERLCLRHTPSTTLSILSDVPSLRHLTLFCSDDEIDDVDDVLAELATRNRLEGLVLVDVNITERTFPLIKALHNLELLAIKSSKHFSVPESKNLPTKLKTLKLEGFRVDNGDIASVVGRLTNLEDMLLQDCELLRDEAWVTDFDWMAELVIKDLSGKHIRQNLNVALEANNDQSAKTVKSVGQVRITNYVENRHLF